ncbi:hypothetical protein Hypma_003151 [Hypsizygus marmoreus]|uniref:Uncharacterized protein n=1 Tax=Hypsizygus marmoreus TaxID=39966 RepID=A0A369K187_HYPMA|nr:hypothetical protein Hypma_003151 [Hypsizygus marmoreus]
MAKLNAKALSHRYYEGRFGLEMEQLVRTSIGEGRSSHTLTHHSAQRGDSITLIHINDYCERRDYYMVTSLSLSVGSHLTQPLPRRPEHSEGIVWIETRGKAVRTSSSKPFQTLFDHIDASCSLFNEPRHAGAFLPPTTMRFCPRGMCSGFHAIFDRVFVEIYIRLPYQRGFGIPTFRTHHPPPLVPALTMLLSPSGDHLLSWVLPQHP